MSRVLAVLAALAPPGLEPTSRFERAVAFSGVDAEAGTLLDAAVGTLALGTAAAAGLLLSPIRGRTVLAAVALGTAALLGYGCYGVPTWLATARRARAVGDVPDLVGLATLRARVAPTPEAAAAFAGEHARDPLAASLREHARRARGTPRAGWVGFADAWGDWDPSLRRAVSLLGAAVDADPGDRERLLRRALDVVLAGTRDRMADYATAVRGPTSALYAFGVVLPLALVATLPAARGAGLPVSVAAVVAVYDVALPGLLLAAGAWLLARRPAAFPPASVPRSHPDVRDAVWPAVAAAAVVGLLAWLALGRWGPGWARWLSGPGTAAGAGLLVHFDPVRRVRGRVRAIEGGLADALAYVGQRLQRGESLERAVAAAGAELSGPTADVFSDAAAVQRRLRVDVRESFLGDAGALATVPSPRARAGAELLALAASEGGEGGRVLVEMADHVDDLAAVERDARQDLAPVTGTLRSTAFCFAPLVGGVTVALGTRLGAVGLERTPAPLPADALGLAVGAYVLLLAAFLAGLAAALDRGLDRALVGFQVGAAVLAASVCFPIAVVAAGTLL